MKYADKKFEKNEKFTKKRKELIKKAKICIFLRGKS
jgi:hypothetical protein